jgi:hypothetical protein
MPDSRFNMISNNRFAHCLSADSSKSTNYYQKIYNVQKKKKLYLFAPNVRDILCRWGAAEVRDQLHLIYVCKQREK